MRHLYRVICTFLTKAACCRNIEIVLHPTTLSYIYIHIIPKKIIPAIPVRAVMSLYAGAKTSVMLILGSEKQFTSGATPILFEHNVSSFTKPDNLLIAL